MIPRNVALHIKSRGLRQRTPEITSQRPALLRKAGALFCPGVHDLMYRHEPTAGTASINPQESRVLRIANHWSIVNAGTEDMVRLKHDDHSEKYCGIEMIAYIAPMNGGQRRGCRNLSGFTPLYDSRSDNRVWGLTGDCARVRVKWPFFRTTNEILGHQFDAVWILSECGCIVYMLQHPDPSYRPIFERTVAQWERVTPAGLERLCTFSSLDLNGPCPAWMIKWVFQMLRLEQKVILRASGTTFKGGVESHEGQDDVSDAGSLSDSEAGNLPHSTKWDWEPEHDTELGGTTEAMGVHGAEMAPGHHSSPLFTSAGSSPLPSESPAREALTDQDADASSTISDFLLGEW